MRELSITNLLSSSWTLIVLVFLIPGIGYLLDNVKEKENYAASSNLLRVILIVLTGLIVYSLYLSFV